MTVLCRQAEFALVVGQDLPDEHQPDSLAGRFGCEERGEEFLSGFFAYAGSIVFYDNR